MSAESTPPAPGFGAALRWWFQLGCISFGGPAGQIAMMQTELVEKRRWISQGRFLHALQFCMVLPGPEAQQLATYLGWLLHGVRGGIAAGLLFVLPSLLLMIGLSWAYLAVGASAAATLLAGVKPAVVAIIAVAAWRLGTRTLRRRSLWAMTLVSFVLLEVLPPNLWTFPMMIAAAFALGWWFRAALLARAAPSKAQSEPHPPAVIDDDTPLQAHAEPDRWRLARIAAIGIVLGVAVWSVLAFAQGAEGPLARMASFFTQAALVTFGGAYAVMPYVFQNAVQGYGWLTPAQMLDGLALGESTPGPLIMVVAFIGYLGMAGAAHSPALGVAGALTATFFTFLPSFLFILLGAPFVERTRSLKVLQAPLMAITAVVVGAILHLAVAVGGAVLMPRGVPDAFAIVLAIGGILLLARGTLGVLPLIATAAVLGWLREGLSLL